MPKPKIPFAGEERRQRGGVAAKAGQQIRGKRRGKSREKSRGNRQKNCNKSSAKYIQNCFFIVENALVFEL